MAMEQACAGQAMDAIAPLVLTDPVYRERPLNAPQRAAARMIRDPRDLPFFWIVLALSLSIVPAAAWLLANPTFSWWLAGGYLAVLIGLLLPPVQVMFHNMGHRPLFKPRYRILLHYLNWVLGPLFGLYPNSFYSLHIAMHHSENNYVGDMTSTMSYQRDRLPDFLRYAGNFITAAYARLPFYLWRRGRKRLVRAVVVGELVFLAVVLVALWFNPRGALVVFIIPALAVVVGAAGVNWSEHAFIDPRAPHDAYRSAIVCVNSLYNHIAFNDGYHVGHHLKPGLHWTEMAKDFERNREAYAREQTIVFDGLDYYRVWFLLMTHQYDVLARHCLNLGRERRTLTDTVAMLRERTARFAA
jgi:fatty acid desaturase